MADPLPPDPYNALGVAKDATTAAVKAQYRKLVLKCHPDKVKDEAEKQVASDNFHKIQTAWEIIGDEARRARYDAQVKLQELRKDVFHGHGGHGESRRSGGVDVRTASFKVPTESARGGYFDARGPDRYGPKVSPPPQYEERRPSFASDDYFEEPSRSTSRKYDDYERTPKRAPPREDRDRARAKDTRENERSSRKDKSRRTDKDVRRDRAAKPAYVEVQEEYASDEYERLHRTPPEDEGLRRARADFFADPYVREAPGNYDDRSRKTFEQFEEAKAHMERSRGQNRPRGESAPRDLSPPPPSEPRPEPVRMSSSKDKIERTKREARGGFFGNVRHGSGDRPKANRAKTEKEQKSSDEDRRNSRRKEESRDSKKRPTLNPSKSSPPEVRPSFTRQRSHTMQEEQTEEHIPHIRRSDTMPLSPTGPPPARETRRRDESRLHPESASYPSPDLKPEPEHLKFRYGQSQIYADDNEFAPTPDGFKAADSEPFRTQEHVPSRDTGRKSTRESTRPARYTNSPEPIKETERERPAGRRTSSARHTTPQKPSLPRTTSTQYVVEPEGVRPAPSRENSGRDAIRNLSRENSSDRPLFREIHGNGTRSGSPRGNYSFAPPDDVRYAPRYKESDVRVQSGYSRRQDEKPSYSRNSSGLQRQAVYAS